MTSTYQSCFPWRQIVIFLRTIGLFLVLLINFGGCASKTMMHGHSIDKINLEKIQIGKSTRIDLLASFGKPSFNGAFNSGRIYYVSQKMTEPAGGKKRTETRQIVAFTLDSGDIVTAVDIIDEKSAKNVLHLDEKTYTPGDNFGVIEQIFSNLRRQRKD